EGSHSRAYREVLAAARLKLNPRRERKLITVNLSAIQTKPTYLLPARPNR
ncbi:MAG: hypothetical protein ACJAZ6_002254, partial [Oleispira sp.]